MTKKETVINYIKDQIDRGKLCPGDRVLSENQIIDYLKVSRNTARNALKELVFEGVLETRKGSGTYVRKNKNKIIVISTKQAFFIYEPGYYIRRLISKLEEMIKSIGYEPYINFEKSEEAYEYWESKPYINETVFSFEDNIGAFISLNGNAEICQYFAEKNIPVITMNNSRGNYYYSVNNDYVDLFNKTLNFAENIGKNTVFFLHINNIPDTAVSKFTIFYAFEHYIDNNYIKVNVPVCEKNKDITKYIDNYLKNLDFVPDGVVFFQDSIYKNAIPLFPKYDYIFSKAKILVVSNNDDFFPENYNITRIVFEPDELCEKIINMLKSLLNNRIPKKTIEMIKGVIVN